MNILWKQLMVLAALGAVACGSDSESDAGGGGSKNKGGSAGSGTSGASGGGAAGTGGASTGGKSGSSTGGNSTGGRSGGSGGASGAGDSGGGGEAGNGMSGAGGSGDSLGPVQCRTTDDCPGEPTAGGCFVSRPGGVCTRCDVRGVCPSGTECIPDTADTAICARPCTGDTDCNVGMFCDTDDYCRPRPCGNGTGCPNPYTCDSGGHCARPTCAADCPAPLVCGGAFCVEP